VRPSLSLSLSLSLSIVSCVYLLPSLLLSLHSLSAHARTAGIAACMYERYLRAARRHTREITLARVAPHTWEHPHTRRNHQGTVRLRPSPPLPAHLRVPYFARVRCDTSFMLVCALRVRSRHHGATRISAATPPTLSFRFCALMGKRDAYLSGRIYRAASGRTSFRSDKIRKFLARSSDYFVTFTRSMRAMQDELVFTSDVNSRACVSCAACINVAVFSSRDTLSARECTITEIGFFFLNRERSRQIV